MAYEMNAGRELDALVAEKVMGLNFPDNYLEAEKRWVNLDPTPADCIIMMNVIPHYSTQIADAWRVVEKLLPHFRLEYYDAEAVEGHTDYTDTTGWHCDFWLDSGHGCAEAGATAPLAICLAALKAVDDG